MNFLSVNKMQGVRPFIFQLLCTKRQTILPEK